MAKETILYGEVKFREKSISEDLAARLLAIDANGNLVDRPAISTSTFISTSLADGRVWIGSAGGVATAVDTAAVGDIDADSVNGLTIKAGTIVDVDINGAAAIAYSKLNLAGSIVNADVSASAAITYSKLTLSNSIVNADIAAAAAITRTKVATGTAYRLVANNSAGVLSENAAITASRAVVSDGNGQLIHSATTAAEIAFVSGLNAAVQTQLDDEIATKTVKAIVKAPTVAEHGYAITWDNSTGTWDLTDPVTQGIPLGGNTRQVLMKIDGTDWNATWDDLVLTDLTDVSAVAADLNLLAGANTAGLTSAHLLHLIGASSNLQSQINGKLAATLAQNAMFVGNSSDVPSALAPGSNGQVLSISSGVPTWTTLVGTGTVTSVAVSGGTTGLSTSGGPISTSGTITLAGTLIPANGGTGFASYTVGDILYASSTTALSKLAIGTNGHVLTLAGGIPSWAAPTGSISGLTAGRVPVAASATTLTNYSAFTWDSTNSALTIDTIRILRKDKTFDDLFMGASAGTTGTTGSGGNTAFGHEALSALTTGAYNTAVGYGALDATTTGTHNTAVGLQALATLTTGTYNTAIGFEALIAVLDGVGNIGVGRRAGSNITTGDENVIIGHEIDAQSATADGQLSIQNAIFGLSNTASGTTVSTGTIGVFVAAPTASLDIAAGTTAKASLRIRKGVAPTAPNDGDIWYNDAAETLHVQINGVTRTFTVV